SVSYNTGIASDAVTPGSKIFNLRVRDEAEGVRLTNRRFYMNYAPDTWFSGPDTLAYPKEDAFNRFSERFVTMLGANGWRNMGPQPASLLSCDSLALLPAMRPERKTFFEIYQNRLYVHAENDTVRLNSYVLLHSGGSDLDSPYDVRVADHDPDLAADTVACALLAPNPAVVHRTGPNGSPIGFH